MTSDSGAPGLYLNGFSKIDDFEGGDPTTIRLRADSGMSLTAEPL